MKTFSSTLLMMAVMILCGCLIDNNVMAQNTMTQKMNITIDGATQSVTLYDNSATQALVAKLQEGAVTVTLNSSGGFEIWGALGFSLPTSNEQITAQPGDVILYNGSNICLMYGSNSWSYTRLGKIDGLSDSELATFLKAGQSNIGVTLSLPPSHEPKSKTLVVYYSYTGNCHEIVQTLTSQIEADVVRIEPADKTQRYEANGYAVGTQLLNAINANPDSPDSYPAIDPVDVDLANYNTYIIVTPLWWSQMAAIMQTYLFHHGAEMAGKHVGLIVSSHSSGISGVVADCKRLVPNGIYFSNLWINASNHANRATLIQNWLEAIDYDSISGASTAAHDLNGDGMVDVADVNIIIDMVLRKIEQNLDKADLDHNAVIDVGDVSILIDILLGKRAN